MKRKISAILSLVLIAAMLLYSAFAAKLYSNVLYLGNLIITVKDDAVGLSVEENTETGLLLPVTEEEEPEAEEGTEIIEINIETEKNETAINNENLKDNIADEENSTENNDSPTATEGEAVLLNEKDLPIATEDEARAINEEDNPTATESEAERENEEEYPIATDGEAERFVEEELPTEPENIAEQTVNEIYEQENEETEAGRLEEEFKPEEINETVELAEGPEDVNRSDDPEVTEPTPVSDEELQNAVWLQSMIDEFNENCSIDIYVSFEGSRIRLGEPITLLAVLNGYENAVFTLQWQYSTDDVNWTDIDGAEDYRYTVVLDNGNNGNFWRVVVNVTELILPDESSETETDIKKTDE